MPIPRPRTALRAAHSLTSTTTTLTRPSLASTTTQARKFSTTRPVASAEESQYDQPSGWLFGVKPGEKAEKEGWEGIFIYGFFGSMGLATVAYAFKPDTSIQTWALEEARRRLEVEGILKEPEDKS